jgi:hypothetical protein
MGCASSWVRVTGTSLLVAFVLLLPACGGSSKSAGYPEAASAESEPYYGDRDGDGLSDSVDAYDMASEAPAPEPSSAVAENEQIQITGPLSGAPAVRKKRNSLFGQSDARRRSASSPNAPPPPPKMAKKPAPGSTEPAEPPIQSPAPDDEKRTDAGMRPMLIYKASLGLAVFKVQQNLGGYAGG